MTPDNKVTSMLRYEYESGRAIFQDIHVLAWHYHWNEAAIPADSEASRQMQALARAALGEE